MKTSPFSTQRNLPRPLASSTISPHVLFFIFYNLLYLLPLLLAFGFGYEDEGSVGRVLGVTGTTILKACAIYMAGIIAFVAGSSGIHFLSWSKYGRLPAPRPFRQFQIGIAEWLAIGILIAVFVSTKIALVPLGVYNAYAFDTGLMDSNGIWSFSTFCSEAMVLVALIVLFSNAKHNIAVFLLLSGINGINLLHGTRIFFISSMMSLMLYANVRGKITYKAVLFYGPILGTGVLLLTYLVFLSRSAVDVAGAFTPAKLISPLIYESVFSQMSLLTLIKTPMIWGGLDTLGWFPHDVFVFTIPRFLVPDKGELQYIGQFYWLSPLGAFNGYAQALLYFGLLFPFCYFLLGVLGSWLFRLGMRSPWWFIFYALFTEDFFLHLARDGYIISTKMLLNSLELLAILIAWRYSIKACRRQYFDHSGSKLSTGEM
jgi:hypothetical protein